MVNGFFKDLQFAFRRLRRAPFFAGTVMLILGLGIGASTTTLSLVNAFMWRSVNLPRADELITIRSQGTTSGVGGTTPLPVIEGLAQAGLPVDGLCGYGSGIFPTDVHGRSGWAPSLIVAGDCFAAFQIQPVLGRLIGSADAPVRGKGGAVVLLGYGFWQRMFGGAADVVGQTMRIDNTVMTVVGVLPQGFSGINKDLGVDLVVPFNVIRPSSGASYLLGRLRVGMSMVQLDTQLRAVWPAALEEALPSTLTGTQRQTALDVEPELQSARAGLSTLRNIYGSAFVEIAILAALLVLLASINVGGLLCSRLASTATELGILRALGASGVRIVRVMLMEAMLLALGGCAIGLSLAFAAAPSLVALLPVGNLPWTISLRPDGRVLAISIAASCLMAFIVTAIPAWLATRRSAVQLAPDRSVTRATSRSARVLLVLQVAATLVLVFGCSLLVRSLAALERADRGYSARDVLSIRLTSTAGGYATLDQPAYYQDLVARVSGLPGVSSVGMARFFGTIPNESGWYSPVSWSGQEQAPTTAIYEYASPGFFQTIGVRLLRGRDFSWSDAPGATPVVLVSDSLARALDPSGEVVGRFLRYGKEPDRRQLLIVGVVGNVSVGNSRVSDIRAVYFPGIQVAQGTYGTLHVGTRGDLQLVAEGVREILSKLGHEQVVVVSTIDGLFTNWLVAERMAATVSTVVTVLALCIACVGVYSLLAYAVARRTREMGIRIAVGATARDIAALVVRDAAILAGLGVAIGIPAALASSRLLDSLMFGVTTTDPTMLIASAALLIVIAVSASAIPAWRAVSVDPTIALRAE